ncbi:hypothetical protein PMAYCL1PPCAC_24760 [Pristionchus mayeri]|uniref:Uncharacterized protein n=1 Tax=Pristionchus mayeri TaxID=1317129 RepID=A0AAN5D2E7_9BILA|nr:hypothetical protein PMAYCL1PPCAC_24760 [Pristionchus mayeri]
MVFIGIQQLGRVTHGFRSDEKLLDCFHYHIDFEAIAKFGEEINTFICNLLVRRVDHIEHFQ